MRSGSDDWYAFVTSVEILMAVEEELKVTFEDGNLFPEDFSASSITLERIALHVTPYLPMTSDQSNNSCELVENAVRKELKLELSHDSWQLPLLDALFPFRWKISLD